MHIVFIVGSYYPYYSAGGKCAGNIADEMSKSHRITVICVKNFPDQLGEEEHNRQKIIRVWTKEKKNRFYLENRAKDPQSIRAYVYRFLLKLYKYSRALAIVFSRDSLEKELVQNYTQALYRIDEPIDVIIPLCLPFEGIAAAIQFKENQTRQLKVIPYLFDQFAENNRLHRMKLNKVIKKKKHVLLERENYEKADYILAMHSLIEHFSTDLPEIKNITYLEHPLLVKPSINESANDNNSIKIAYVGGLVKNYVEPNYLLELYKGASSNSTLHFYIFGNCASVVDKYSRVMPTKIINHGSVDKETANREISNSDILISIAEKKGLQKSSKIFDYISCGKPIVHLYSVVNDVNLNVLRKYPNVLCIMQDKELMSQNVLAFNKFCEVNRNIVIPFSEVSTLFQDATPGYTVIIIEDIINS